MPDILERALKDFDVVAEHEEESWRETSLADLRFVRLLEQWPEDAKKMRGEDRPTLTIDKLNPVIRQVVNDARQNKPAISVRPAGGGADKATADILSGLIRNIEQASDADIATDTAVESAVSGGVGYFRFDISDEGSNPFERDIVFERVRDAHAVYGDPYSDRADSKDWMSAFVLKAIPKARFEKEYKDSDPVDWEGDYGELSDKWVTKQTVTVAEYWVRERVERNVLMLSNSTTVYEDEYAEQAEMFAGQGIIPVSDPQPVPYHKVTQYLMTGAEVLEENEWPGQYIPIVPVYGEEINVEGKRFFRSLIHSAKDAQRMFNYWRSTTTELVTLAPKSPYVGEEGAFDADPDGWGSINTAALPYVEYSKGSQPPQRQPFSGVPAGALQEALNASDDIKSITGIHDASLGARSNETSGVAIRTRQMEGDVSTFHFIDNLSRAIRHGGRILLDLIPKVYNADRIVRILGPDMNEREERISPNAQAEMQQAQQQAVQQFANAQGRDPDAEELAQLQKELPRIYDISAGQYDLTVKAGPSYTSMREETRRELVELMRSAGAPEERQAIAKLYLKNSDWPGAEELLEEMEDDGIPEELKGQIQEGMQRIQQLEQENNELKGDQWIKQQELQLKAEELKFKQNELTVKQIEAEAEFLRAQAEHAQSRFVPDSGVTPGMMS